MIVYVVTSDWLL